MLAIKSPQLRKGLFCRNMPLGTLTLLSSTIGAELGAGSKLAEEANLKKMEACLLWSSTASPSVLKGQHTLLSREEQQGAG